MAATSLCNDDKALTSLVNLHDINELKCLRYTQLKQELQELLIEVKSAIKINDILKYETVCGANLDKECAKCSVLSFQLQEATVELKSTKFYVAFTVHFCLIEQFIPTNAR
jgi:hypothetical protein